MIKEKYLHRSPQRSSPLTVDTGHHKPHVCSENTTKRCRALVSPAPEHTEKNPFAYWAPKTETGESTEQSISVHNCVSLSRVPGPPAACFHFCGPAGDRIVFSATCRTPFISQPVTLGLCLLKAKPRAPGSTRSHLQSHLLPRSSHYPQLKSPRLFFFQWDWI